jgi:anti-sigma regulatory factor (Ser/Thr protein kinase)
LPERADLAGAPGIHELSIHADGAEVRRATEWLEASCRENQVPPALVDRLILCLNEVLANVIAHGGTRTPPVTLRLEINPDESGFEASVTVSDRCRAFDPLSVPKRARPASLDDAPTSGMGLEIIRGCSDVLRYKHEGGRNHLTFGARWKLQ